MRGWRNIRRGIIFESRKPWARKNFWASSLARSVSRVMRRKFFSRAKLMEYSRSLLAEAVMAVILMDDEILEEEDEAPLGGRDGEEEIDHRQDAAILAQDEDAPAAGLLEDQAQAAHVLGAVGLEVAFEGEEVEEEFRELRKIVKRGRFDGDMLHLKGICHMPGAAGRDF